MARWEVRPGPRRPPGPFGGLRGPIGATKCPASNPGASCAVAWRENVAIRAHSSRDECTDSCRFPSCAPRVHLLLPVTSAIFSVEAEPPSNRQLNPWRLSVAPMMDWTDRHCRYFHRLLTRSRAAVHRDGDDRRAAARRPCRATSYRREEHPVALQLGGSEPRPSRTWRGRRAAGATTRSTSTAAARASACSAARSAPA